MNIEERLDSLLRRGWRVHIKSHIINRSWSGTDLGPPEGGLDPKDAVYWMAQAHLWRHPKGIRANGMSMWHGAVVPTVSEALDWMEKKIEQIEASPDTTWQPRKDEDE